MRRIKGEGPVPSLVMLIADWPTREDDKTGRPFSTHKWRGNEIDRFFDGVRLPSRDSIYCTTFVKEYREGGEYPEADFVRDVEQLRTELGRVQPAILICLGRHTSRWFLGDVDLEEVHGIAWHLPTTFEAVPFSSPPMVVPLFSIGAGLHSSEISAHIAYDFGQLEDILSGDTEPRTLYADQFPNPQYIEVTNVDELERLLANTRAMAVDSEGWNWRPWSVQFSDESGTASIVRFSNAAVIRRFVEIVQRRGDTLRHIFHGSLHDLGVYRAFGIDTRRLVFDDTQVMSYNLQLEPIGLKPLCVRHAGMVMDSYDSVMGDASYRLAQDWLFNATEIEEWEYVNAQQAEFTRLTTTPYLDKKGTLKPGRRLRTLPKLPRTDLHAAFTRCLRSTDPRKLWGNQSDDRHIEAGAKHGAMWEATLDAVPLPQAIYYAGRDADGTGRLEPELRQRLVRNELWNVYQADLATIPLIDRMQQIGIRPDLAHFSALSGVLQTEVDAIQARLDTRLSGMGISYPSGNPFNANSTDQVGSLLYDRFGVTVLKRTPGGDPSTNDKILEAVEKDPRLDRGVRDLVIDIREYREIYKLKHTFVDQIPDFVNRWPNDGRIHSTFRITRVVTGRLAASDPNLLAMPKHGKFAKQFREGFICDDNHLLGSWDLSQIELRVLAHISQDPVLLNAFRTGLDLHATLAQRIFGVAPDDQDDSKHRFPAKAINFGLSMGMTNIGLTIELKKNGLDVSEDDAQRWIDGTMSLYAEVPNYQQYKIAEAKRQGYVTDLVGRRRYIGGIRSFDRAARAEAERFAFSTPIQAGAQEIMKVAEAALWQIILDHQDAGRWVEPLIQIHDDLLLEFQEDLLEELNLQMQYAMTQTFPALSVPIQTVGASGINWGKMEKIA